MVVLYVHRHRLARRGLLDQAQAKIPPALPLARIAALVPPVLWSLLAMSCFVALLVFALMAPSTLGGGLAHLGSSYGTPSPPPPSYFVNHTHTPAHPHMHTSTTSTSRVGTLCSPR